MRKEHDAGATTAENAEKDRSGRLRQILSTHPEKRRRVGSVGELDVRSQEFAPTELGPTRHDKKRHRHIYRAIRPKVSFIDWHFRETEWHAHRLLPRGYRSCIEPVSWLYDDWRAEISSLERDPRTKGILSGFYFRDARAQHDAGNCAGEQPPHDSLFAQVGLDVGQNSRAARQIAIG